MVRNLNGIGLEPRPVGPAQFSPTMTLKATIVFIFFVGAAFANRLLVTSFSVSGVVWRGGGGGGGYFFNLHFGDSFLLDHREEELQFKSA